MDGSFVLPNSGFPTPPDVAELLSREQFLLVILEQGRKRIKSLQTQIIMSERILQVLLKSSIALNGLHKSIAGETAGCNLPLLAPSSH